MAVLPLKGVASIAYRQVANQHGPSAARAKELQDELIRIWEQQDRLLNLRLLEEINADAYAKKAQVLRDRESELKLQTDTADRNRHEIGTKSSTLRSKRLNFLKTYGPNGLQRIGPQNVESSNSCV